jgi:hypothetical protein
MWKPHPSRQALGVRHNRVKLDPTTVNAHLAILRELNAPPSVIKIAERVAAATSSQVRRE